MSRIRPATPADAEASLVIYEPVVKDTAISWEYEPPTLEEFKARIESTLNAGYPWIAMEDEGVLIGYAYASSYRGRYAYRFCCESTIYLHPDFQGQGLGKHLYATLLEILKRQGYVAVIGGLAVSNPASEALHRSLGFQIIGVQEKIGFKFGQWLNLCLMQKDLTPRAAPNLEKPIPFLELANSGSLDDLFDAIRDL